MRNKKNQNILIKMKLIILNHDNEHLSSYSFNEALKMHDITALVCMLSMYIIKWCTILEHVICEVDYDTLLNFSVHFCLHFYGMLFNFIDIYI